MPSIALLAQKASRVNFYLFKSSGKNANQSPVNLPQCVVTMEAVENEEDDTLEIKLGFKHVHLLAVVHYGMASTIMSSAPGVELGILSYMVDKQKQTATPMKYIVQTTISATVAMAYLGGISVSTKYMGRARNKAAPIKWE